MKIVSCELYNPETRSKEQRAYLIVNCSEDEDVKVEDFWPGICSNVER